MQYYHLNSLVIEQLLNMQNKFGIIIVNYKYFRKIKPVRIPDPTVEEKDKTKLESAKSH